MTFKCWTIKMTSIRAHGNNNKLKKIRKSFVLLSLQKATIIKRRKILKGENSNE